METEDLVTENDLVDSQLDEFSPSTPLTASTGTVIEKKGGPRTSSESASSSPKTTPSSPKTTPRATRSSQNPDFAAKQRKFLNSVHDPMKKERPLEESDSSQSSLTSTPTSSKSTKDSKTKSVEQKHVGEIKRRINEAISKRPADSTASEEGGPAKKRKTKEPTKVVGGVDSYCWRCHRDGNVIHCELCPRVYHLKCVQMEAAPNKGWVCPECSTVMRAENTDTRSRAMRMLSLEQLCNLLRFALNRMKNHEGADDFAKPVDTDEFQNYREYIVKAMDLSTLERNIKNKLYGSTEAFLADARWMLHNSIIFNSVQSKFSNTARALLKICRQEMQEIENCPDCYQNAHTRSSDSWFIEACRRPHLLVWAKLKGFPFWPAKAMSMNSDGQVDVRFFGAHDRAWVPLNQCFLYSKLPPAPTSTKNKRNLDDSLQELENHVKKLRDKFGQFECAPYKTNYDPEKEDEQLALLLPKYEAKVPGRRTIRLHQDGARKSLLRKASPARKAARDSSPKPPNTDKTAVAQVAENAKPTKPMVSFPDGKEPTTSNQEVEPDTSSTTEEQQNAPVVTTPLKVGTPLAVKKPKTPLTAAAKKCFASEEKICFKCNIKTTAAWSRDSEGRALCSSCTLSRNKDGCQKERSCSKCQTRTSSTWHQSALGPLFCDPCNRTESVDKLNINAKMCTKCTTTITMLWMLNNDGETICSSCGYAEFYKTEEENDPNSSKKVTVTAQRKQQSEQLTSSDEPMEVEGGQEEDKAEAATGPGPAPVAEEGASVTEGVAEGPHATTDSHTGFAAESPVKLIMSKGDSQEPLKKVSIVDRLQEKLCFAIEEAIKGHAGIEGESTETEKSVDEPKEPSEDNEKEKTISEETKVMQVVLHDLKNDKKIMDKIRQNKSKRTIERTNSNNDEPETHTLSETSSEPETDCSSSAESESLAIDEEKRKMKKQNNINKVVKSLKDRKNSVDERSEKNSKEKGTTPVLLDDSNDDSAVLIIDETELSPTEKKKTPGKPDKSRRKGIPAKVFSRSSSSTECSEISLPEDTPAKSKEVLDEVSGQFRRSSEDSNLTITLVTDDESPKKKSKKEVRSVNITKSLSLSVINDAAAALDMECVENEDEEEEDEQVIVDSVIKKTPNHIPLKPTARKTLPNAPPKSVELPLPRLQEKVLQRDVAVKVRDPSTPPPPLVSQQPRVFGPSRAQTNNNTTAAAKQSVPPAPSSSNTPQPPAKETTTKHLVGETSTKFEEGIKKVSGKLRSVVEEFLREIAESGVTEATVQAMQLEMERLQWRHAQEIAELKHNTDLLVMEIRATLETDKQRALLDAKHKYEVAKEQAVADTKRKQWCANCQKEAQLYCCWNTAYCSYVCQQMHWVPHMNSCMNKSPSGNAAEVPRPSPNRAFTPNTGQMHVADAWYSEQSQLEEEDTESIDLTVDQHNIKHAARRRCGECPGCVAPPCGDCYGCSHPKSHTVCKNRRCSYILTKPQRVHEPTVPPRPQPPPYNARHNSSPVPLPYANGPSLAHRVVNGNRPAPHMYSMDPHFSNNPQ